MDRVKIPALFMFGGQDHLLHAGVEWKERSRLRFHSFFILSFVSDEHFFMHVMRHFLCRHVQPIQSNDNGDDASTLCDIPL